MMWGLRVMLAFLTAVYMANAWDALVSPRWSSATDTVVNSLIAISVWCAFFIAPVIKHKLEKT